MKQLNGFRRGWIGGGEEILNVPRLAHYASLTPQFVSSLANEYDFCEHIGVGCESDNHPGSYGLGISCRLYAAIRLLQHVNGDYTEHDRHRGQREEIARASACARRAIAADESGRPTVS